MTKFRGRRDLRPVSRRDFVKGALAGSVGVATHATGIIAATPPRWPEYVIRRELNELFIRVTAVGYAETPTGYLKPHQSTRDRFLVFTLPPQHFAETALTPTEIPVVLDESALAAIQLSASAASKLVFRTPRWRWLRLAWDELLAWHEFELLVPDLSATGQKYDLEVSEALPRLSTRIEIPWGVQLSPSVSGAAAQSKYAFTNPARLRITGAWTELWTTALEQRSRADGAAQPLAMEVLSARGFERTGTTGSENDGDLVVTYRNREGQVFPPEPTPLNNYDRITLATSLSRRFPYTGRVGPPPKESALVSYQPSNSCVSACYAEGRILSVSQMRLSARGGWLQLDGNWDPFPGCALSGWVHSTSLYLRTIRCGLSKPARTVS